MKIYACPKCGSRRIFMGTMDSGITIGITSNNYICEDCGYQGMPLIFDSEKEYKLFLKGLLQEIKAKVKNKDGAVDETADDLNIELSKSDKEIIDFLKELIDEENDFGLENIDEKPAHWHGNRSWWIEIGIAFSISVIISISNLPLIIDYIDATLIVYYIMVFFIDTLIILATIVFIEYFVLFKFKKKIKK